MPLHSCAEPNSVKFNFGVTADSDGVLALIQTAYLRQT